MTGKLPPSTSRHAAFHWDDRDVALVITDASGRSILEFDAVGNLVGIASFDGLPGSVDTLEENVSAFLEARIHDLPGRVRALEGEYAGLEASIEALISAGLPGLRNLPASSEGLSAGSPFAEMRTLRFAPAISTLYSQSLDSLVPDHQGLYALYDGLMSEHPSYVVREKLGEDSLGNEVLAYRFTPPAIADGSENPFPGARPTNPLLITVTGTHGHERTAQLCTFIAIKEVCEDWAGDEMLCDLRWGCDFVIIPALTPSAIDRGRRTNPNGVDINRNFPADWGGSGSTDPHNSHYRGPSAGSEPETLIAMELPERFPGVTAVIDHHNFGGGGGIRLWLAAANPFAREIAQPYLNRSAGYMRREVAAVTEPVGQRLTRLSNSIFGSLVRQMEARGIPSYMIETSTELFGGTAFMRRHNTMALKRLWHANYQAEINRRLIVASAKGNG